MVLVGTLSLADTLKIEFIGPVTIGCYNNWISEVTGRGVMKREDDEDDDGGIEHSLGEDDFDYDEYIQQEFGGKSSLKPLWLFTAWVLLIAIVVPTLIALSRLL